MITAWNGVISAYIRLTEGEFDGYVAFDTIEQATNWVNSKQGDDCTVRFNKIAKDAQGNVEVAHLHYFDESITLADPMPAKRDLVRTGGVLVGFTC